MVHVGTSGWIYKGWAGSFYPEDVRPAAQLEFYATRFDSVEINASFYRLQKPEVVRAWRQRVPAGFRFAIKGSRFITHMKKLRVEKSSIQVFFDRAKLLREKTGPVLWQLPPNLHADTERLHAFLRILPRRFRHAVEFRHPSWLEDPRTLEVLREHDAALVWLSSLAMPPVTDVTTDFVYLRFHGLEGGAAHDYTAKEMKPWADACRRCAAGGHDVYAYFNNDWNTRAPKNAETFRSMVGETEQRAARRRSA